MVSRLRSHMLGVLVIQGNTVPPGTVLKADQNDVGFNTVFENGKCCERSSFQSFHLETELQIQLIAASRNVLCCHLRL